MHFLKKAMIFHSKIIFAAHPFKFCAVLEDLAVILKQLNSSRENQAHLPGSSWGCWVVSGRLILPAEEGP